MNKALIIISLIFLLMNCKESKNENNSLGESVNLTDQLDSFQLVYYFKGLGSNQFQEFYPKIKIDNNNIVIKAKDSVISTIKIGRASVDSIVELVRELKDTTIFETNPCIMSGGIYFLTITTDKNTVNYQLKNTFELRALKIVEIINSYLPTDNKIEVTEQLIKREKDCWESMKKKALKEEKK